MVRLTITRSGVSLYIPGIGFIRGVLEIDDEVFQEHKETLLSFCRRGNLSLHFDIPRGFLGNDITFYTVKSATTPVPPESSAEGDMYIVPDDAIGPWENFSQKVAVRVGNGWVFMDPIDGSRAYAEDSKTYYRFTRGRWEAEATHSSVVIVETAGDFLNAERFVVVGENGLVKANPLGSFSDAYPIGMTLNAAEPGSKVQVAVSGIVKTSKQLVPNAIYYLRADGEFGISPPPDLAHVVIVGKALDENVFLVSIQYVCKKN